MSKQRELFTNGSDIMGEDRDPDCTCRPDCEHICIGWCGCEACWHPDAEPTPEPGELSLEELTAMQCPHCGRPSIYGHKPDCTILGGELDRVKDERQRVQQRIKELRQQIKRLEGSL